MNIKMHLFIFICIIIINVVKGHMPGTFFWRPRVGITFKAPEDEDSGLYRSKILDFDDYVIVIKGYQFAKSLDYLANGIATAMKFKDQNPFSGYYYTNVYRWMIRHYYEVLEWLSITDHYTYSHKVWNKRYWFMDKFVPQWLRKIFFFVDEKEWEQEEKEYKRYIKYAEPTFGKRYVFNYSLSEKSATTIENLDTSELSYKHQTGDK